MPIRFINPFAPLPKYWSQMRILVAEDEFIAKVSDYSLPTNTKAEVAS